MFLLDDVIMNEETEKYISVMRPQEDDAGIQSIFLLKTKIYQYYTIHDVAADGLVTQSTNASAAPLLTQFS